MPVKPVNEQEKVVAAHLHFRTKTRFKELLIRFRPVYLSLSDHGKTDISWILSRRYTKHMRNQILAIHCTENKFQKPTETTCDSNFQHPSTSHNINRSSYYNARNQCKGKHAFKTNIIAPYCKFCRAKLHQHIRNRISYDVLLMMFNVIRTG